MHSLYSKKETLTLDQSLRKMNTSQMLRKESMSLRDLRLQRLLFQRLE